MMMRKSAGFTLIELMVVLAIVAILSAIAIPAFTKQMQKSRRSEAASALSDLQLREEKWRASHATYASSLTILLGSSATATAYNNNLTYYSIAISGTSGTGFTLTATPKSTQVNDTACNPMKIIVSANSVSKTPTTNRCWS